MVKFANRVKSIELSQIRKMFEIKNEKSINLGIGEPDFNVPENIKIAMKNAIDNNFSHYTPNKGFLDLREEIAKKFQKENNIKTNPENIIVSSGASEALYLCSQSLFNKDDEVIIPNPGFLSYEACVKLSEAKPIPIDCKIENNFKLKAEDLENKISKNTKALILNSPSNPTGAIIDKEDIKAIADLSIDYNFMVISDEIYEKIIYEKKHYSVGEYSDNVITINGFSKTYAMTGHRIAYLTGNEDIIEELLKVHQYCIACANSVAQKGAYEALTGSQKSVFNMVKEFKRRRDLMIDSLNDMNYKCVKSEGAFYAFPKIENSEDFVLKAAKAGVITVPGIAFGSLGNDHVRMSFANSYENIEKSMDILRKI
ncbi:MAG: pyridoxal phosphate-dependent aminotransferase [Methanobacteriaceae archaeon]|jgi:aspartate aminotransferase|nr:pyridoxal phosphate-dependent aminotransferase [Methanobacteriaceae archaeon]